jgi:hypothetical protein
VSSPTQRSLKLLRSDGWICAIVEKWNPHAKIRQDMFGFIDIICIRGNETLAVQACAYGGVSDRIKKIEEAEMVGAVREAGWQIRVIGWRKTVTAGGAVRYKSRIVDLS